MVRSAKAGGWARWPNRCRSGVAVARWMPSAKISSRSQLVANMLPGPGPAGIERESQKNTGTITGLVAGSACD